MANQRDILHKWAHGLDNSKSNGAVFIADGIAYSYGRHFPLGVRCGTVNDKPAFLLNSRSYSVTTSKHQSWANAATWHGERLILPMNGDIPFGFTMNKDVCNYVEREIKQGEAGTLSRGSRIRANSLSRIHTAVDIAKRYPIFAKAYGATLNKDTAKRLKKAAKWTEDRLNGLADKLAQDAKKEAARVKREAKARVKKQAEALELWKQGERVDVSFVTIALRKVGNEVETTHGAKVPLDAAFMLWNGWGDPALKGRHVGPYAVNEVRPDALIIGCHTITKEAAQDFAARMNW